MEISDGIDPETPGQFTNSEVFKIWIAAFHSDMMVSDSSANDVPARRTTDSKVIRMRRFMDFTSTAYISHLILAKPPQAGKGVRSAVIR
jgi:hypothetical protein